MDLLVFPDSVQAVVGLIGDRVFNGGPVLAGTYLPVDKYGALDTMPFALVIGEGGQPGYVDQVERVRVEVYAPFNDPLLIAQSMRAQLVGENIDTAAGFLDNIRADQVPVMEPYAGDISKAVLLLSVTSRPIN